MIKPLEFFTSRIGHRIFRDHHKCCAQCDEIAENGMIVFDKQHAQYLYDVQNDFAIEGVLLNYRDEK